MSGREDKARGQWDETKGKAKEAFGDLTDDKDLQAEGRMDQAKGKGRKAMGGAKEAFDDAKDAAGDLFDRDKP